MKHLGLPLGVTFKTKSIWDPILDCMQWRLDGWKKLYLSKGGHTTLLKSTLSSLPTCFMSLLFSLPVGVANQMEILQRDFLWGCMGEGFKFHSVGWRLGDLVAPLLVKGVCELRVCLFNLAFLGKWLWRY